MEYHVEPSLVGLAIQTAGIGLIAVLSYMLLRSAPRTSLRFWTAAWACLAIGLATLLLSFVLPAVQWVLQTVYLLGEYTFGYLFYAGCRSHVTGARPSRRDLWMLVPSAALAIVLPPLTGGDLNIFFIPHSAVFACYFYASFRTIGPARRARQGQGVRVVSAALFLLTLDFAHYGPIFLYSARAAVTLPLGYLQYTSLYDLIIEILLGFGTVMLIMEDVTRELAEAHTEVTSARDRLEVLARMDPLTESLNRHAFYSLLEKNRSHPAAALRGCAAVIDLNDLKVINDTYGHSVGDAAIRTVAKAMRSLIRPDDLLFRWGGDEFLVLLFGVEEAEARSRFARLNEMLATTSLPGAPPTVFTSVSYGVAAFAGDAPLDDVIERADSEMYRHKQEARSPRATV